MLDEKSDKAYEYILIYDISYKTLMGAKPLRIRFDEIDGFIKIYDGVRYVLLFRSEQYDAIYIRIRYLISQKMVSQIIAIILQELELIHIIYTYRKNTNLSCYNTH